MPGEPRFDAKDTAEEFKQIYTFAVDMNPELPVIIEAALRRSELVTLRKHQVRGKVAYLDDTKNGERRSVSLSSLILALLEGLPTLMNYWGQMISFEG